MFVFNQPHVINDFSTLAISEENNQKRMLINQREERMVVEKIKQEGKKVGTGRKEGTEGK